MILEVLAPYCGEVLRGTTCPSRRGRWHMCVAAPDHEHRAVEHHVCDCGHGWVTPARGAVD